MKTAKLYEITKLICVSISIGNPPIVKVIFMSLYKKPLWVWVNPNQHSVFDIAMKISVKLQIKCTVGELKDLTKRHFME